MAQQVKVTTQYTGGQKPTKTLRTFELQRPIYIGQTPGTGGSEGGGTLG